MGIERDAEYWARFRKTLIVALAVGLGGSAVVILAFSAYMLSIGVQPPYWVLVFSIPAGIVAAVVLTWLLVPNKGIERTARGRINQ